MRRRSDRGEFDCVDRVTYAVWWLILMILLGMRGCEHQAMHEDIRIIKAAVTLYAPPAEPAEEVPDAE